ncbi:MAG TPA: DUF222 domain-containing protein [Lapillicoccus sp.]|nr:DUF222 domain-containing protein [Lapillicoccus sp.]
MEPGTWTECDELVAVLSAAAAVLQGLPGEVHRLTGPDLDAVLGVVDGLAAAGAAGRFTIAREAQERGEVAASQAGSLAGWVAERCPSLDQREAGLVGKAVRELAGADLEAASEAVAHARLSVGAGCVVASEWRQLAPLVERDAGAAVVAGLVAIGCTDGSVGVRGLRPAMLARYGLGQVLQEIEDRHAGLTVLSCGHDIGGGITEYRLRLNPEGRAVVEAAINQLAAPVIAEDGSVDPRTTEQRRGSALVEVCRRASASCATPASGIKAAVMVTIGLDELQNGRRPGVLVGGVDTGTLLGPETVRRLSCDGAATTAVVDDDGRVVDLGQTRRFFSPRQVQALWLRDRHCTFPGCQTPASWTDAHHVRHWVDGGPTDLGNAALLCGRHHVVVHRDRLSAEVGRDGVTWDRRSGSYDRAVPDRLAPEGPDPPPS